MGNSLSLSGSKTLSGEDLKRNSKEITEMSNALFQFMYTNWQPRDVWEIANDPSKYVIAISDMITDQFHVLGYKTKSGRIGEIYFQKWDALEPAMDKDQLAAANSRNSKNSTNAKNVEKKRATRRQRSDKGYATQKQNAEIIAFYFVRIFQILGAMLLVVKDINIPNYDPNTGQTLASTKNNSSRNFAQQSQQVVSAFRPPTPMKGGRIEFSAGMPLGPYDFLRYYLRKIEPEDIERFNTKHITLDGTKEYMFNESNTMIFQFNGSQYSTLADIVADNKTSQKIGFAVKTPSGFEKVFINISVKEITFDINGETNKLQGYKAPSEREEKTRLSAYPTRVKIEYDVPGKKSSVLFTRVSQAQGSVTLGVEYQFSSDETGLIDFLKAQGLSPRKDFVKMLENVSMYYIKQVNTGIESIQFDAKKKTNNNDDGKGPKVKAPKNKSLESTFSQLTSKDYQPHCIARALQLLDPASINNYETGSGISNICKHALGNKASIKLSEYIPTRSVGQLFGKINPLDYKASLEVLKAFAQKESTGEPLSTDSLNNFPTEQQSLQAAVKRLSTAFGMDKGQKSLSEIELQISSKCDPEKEKGKEILIDRASLKFKAMRSSSQQLLAYHLKQIIEISKFLKKIFNISQRPDGSWKVEGPKTELLFAGFETMNTLTDQARVILIDYYAGCEEIYQRGLKTWEADSKIASDKEAPGPGDVLPSPIKPVAPIAPPAPSAPPAV